MLALPLSEMGIDDTTTLIVDPNDLSDYVQDMIDVSSYTIMIYIMNIVVSCNVIYILVEC